MLKLLLYMYTELNAFLKCSMFKLLQTQYYINTLNDFIYYNYICSPDHIKLCTMYCDLVGFEILVWNKLTWKYSLNWIDFVRDIVLEMSLLFDFCCSVLSCSSSFWRLKSMYANNLQWVHVILPYDTLSHKWLNVCQYFLYIFDHAKYLITPQFF